MLESLTISKSSKLYRFLIYKIPHPEWRAIDAEILQEAIVYYTTYPDNSFAVYFENKIIEEITLALIYLDHDQSSKLFKHIQTMIFSLKTYPEKGEVFVFRLKKAVAGALFAAESCLERQRA
jgi:hypothetical protein